MFEALPPRFLLDNEPPIHGLIKKRNEDFIVEEIPLYSPCGEGEHLYLTVEKNGQPTLEVIRALTRHFHVSKRDVGYAGMKDKHAVTRQTISIRTPIDDDSQLDAFNMNGVQLLSATRHRNKLRLGHLKGNRFTIRIREVDLDQTSLVKRLLNQLAETGVPNYIGEQRFGNRMNNHEVGRHYLLQDWQQACITLAGQANQPDSLDHEARQFFDHGEYRDACHAWPMSHRAERTLTNALATGKTPEQAFLSIDHTIRTFFITAFQSAVFNNVLAHRLTDGTFNQLHTGDLAWKHNPPGAGAVFPITDVEENDPTIKQRLNELDISPSGPLWGYRMMRASEKTDESELTALHATGVDLHDFETPPLNVHGTRRPLRVPITEPDVHSGTDEYGPYIEVGFVLPKGAFATMVVREMQKDESRPM